MRVFVMMSKSHKTTKTREREREKKANKKEKKKQMETLASKATRAHEQTTGVERVHLSF